MLNKQAMVGACAQDGLWVNHVFRGYDMVTLMVVANMAFSGLLVSWVMKFADSIMKVRSGLKTYRCECADRVDHGCLMVVVLMRRCTQHL